MHGPQQIRPRQHSNDLFPFQDWYEPLIPFDHGHFNVMKRRFRFRCKGVGLHHVPNSRLAEPVKQGFLDQLSTDDPDESIVLIDDRKDIDPIRRHSLSGG
jgi:hypothetical protein